MISAQRNPAMFTFPFPITNAHLRYWRIEFIFDSIQIWHLSIATERPSHSDVLALHTPQYPRKLIHDAIEKLNMSLRD